MGKNSIFREFFRYVGLNVLGMIGLSCYILADTYFVSKALGTSGLAALNLAISVYSVINATGLMMGAGGGTRFSIFMFQGHENEARRVYTRTVGLALAAGGVFLLAGLFCVPAIAALLGADADTMDKTTAYLRVILCFAPCFIMNNTLLAFVRNDGNPRLSMAAMLVGSLSNIVLDYVFIAVFGWGIAGAAWATAVGYSIVPVFALFYFWKPRTELYFVKAALRADVLVESCLKTFPAEGYLSLGECTQMWNFLYLDDLLEALTALWQSGAEGVFNVAGEPDETRPLKEYVRLMYEACGCHGSYSCGRRPQNAEGPANLIPDVKKLMEVTGWRQETPFQEGIRRLLTGP